METFLEKSSKTDTKSMLKPSMLLVFMVLSALQSMAQSEAMTEVQKKAEHQEFLSYVFMVVGFVAIIAIAWFSVKKKSGESTNHHHHPVHHHHHHGSHDKRYGTHHAK
jgi:carbon starvation protein CstA